MLKKLINHEAPLSLLWYPKKFKKFKTNKQKVFSTSNRVRAYNFHECLKIRDNINSDIANYSISNPNPFCYDIIICQKNMISLSTAFMLRLSPKKLIVYDMCDPEKDSFYKRCHLFVDLIISSNYQLTEYAKSKGLKADIYTVVDSHEVTDVYPKEHLPKNKIKVTWYGVGSNFFNSVKPIYKHIADRNIVFNWASNDDPSFQKEVGFVRGIHFEMDWRKAQAVNLSWQQFIRSSDVGIVPVMNNKIKSPHKILNYMAHGIPVVCSPTDAHKRIVQNGYNGFLAHSDEDWNKYLQILKDSDIRNKIGQAAFNHVYNQYSVENVSDRYFQFLKIAHKRKSLYTKNQLLISLFK